MWREAWRPLAAKGDADALFNLAQAYRLGRGVPEERHESVSRTTHTVMAVQRATLRHAWTTRR